MTLDEFKKLFVPNPTKSQGIHDSVFAELPEVPKGAHVFSLIKDGKVKRTYFSRDGHLGAVREDC